MTNFEPRSVREIKKLGRQTILKILLFRAILLVVFCLSNMTLTFIFRYKKDC